MTILLTNEAASRRALASRTNVIVPTTVNANHLDLDWSLMLCDDVVQLYQNREACA